MTPDELAAIRERDALFSGDAMSSGSRWQVEALRDRRALLALVDTLTERAETASGLSGVMLAAAGQELDAASHLVCSVSELGRHLSESADQVTRVHGAMIVALLTTEQESAYPLAEPAPEGGEQP